MKLIYCLVALLLTANTGYSQEEYKPGVNGIRREFNIYLPFSTVKQKIHAEVIDGLVIYEGDIVLGTLSEIENMQNQSITFAVSIDEHRWPNSIIPYEIQANHPCRESIEWAIQHVQNKTNLCLIPRTGEESFIRFVPGTGYSSSVGFLNNGAQNITVHVSCSGGRIAHEILHSAGLYHEHSREDRNTYVTFHEENVLATEDPDNFEIRIDGASDIGPYDYGSIMHYSSTTFARPGTETLTINQPPGTSTTQIGQRDGLSPLDIQAINSLYPDSPCANELEVGQSKSISVLANNPLNATGIFVRAGQSFRFKTSTTSWHNDGRATNCDGYSPGTIAERRRRFPDINIMALMGEVYKPNKLPTKENFLIGCGSNIHTFRAAGNLFVFANDIINQGLSNNINGYTRNKGSIQLSITRIE